MVGCTVIFYPNLFSSNSSNQKVKCADSKYELKGVGSFVINSYEHLKFENPEFLWLAQKKRKLK